MFGVTYKFKSRLLIILIVSIIFYFLWGKIIDEKDYPIILWWTPFTAENEQIIECSNYKCKLTNNRFYENHINTKAFLFYGSKFLPWDLPLPKFFNKIWAIYHEESPRNLDIFLDESSRNLFNITSTFSRFSDYPLTLQYLNNLNSIIDSKYFLSTNKKNKLLDKLAPVLYIQSDCDTPIDRDNYVKELMKFIKIDSYGNCLKNKQFPNEINNIHPLDLYNETFLKFIGQYKFILAIENAICHDYITEKIWRPLIVGAIPIYLGSPTIENWLPNNKSAILIKQFNNPKLLADYVNSLNNDDSFYEQYLEHKIKKVINNNKLMRFFALYGNIEETITEFECFICKHIHENHRLIRNDDFNRKIYDCLKPSNSWSIHWDIGQCKAKALNILLKENNNFTKDIFEYLWNNLYRNNRCSD